MAADGSRVFYAPLVKTVEVPLRVEEAFELFTSGITRWWPLASHSVEQTEAEGVVFETGVGGRIYEVGGSGAEHEWGRILEWDPPRRVLYTWYPGRDERSAQMVEVVFAEAGADGTKVELTHRGWETLGAEAEAQRENYDTGWDYVLGCFVGSANDAVP